MILKSLTLGRACRCGIRFAPLARVNLELFDPYLMRLAIGVPGGSAARHGSMLTCALLAGAVRDRSTDRFAIQHRSEAGCDSQSHREQRCRQYLAPGRGATGWGISDKAVLAGFSCHVSGTVSICLDLINWNTDPIGDIPESVLMRLFDLASFDACYFFCSHARKVTLTKPLLKTQPTYGTPD
jgi:hypothetical protein